MASCASVVIVLELHYPPESKNFHSFILAQELWKIFDITFLRLGV